MINMTQRWNEIYEQAEGLTFGCDSLKVKDQARAELEDLMAEEGYNVDDFDGVEDAIDFFLEVYDVLFDDRGNIVHYVKF